MDKYKNEIISRGYSVVAEIEEGIAFVNEDAQFCVMLLKDYDREDKNDKVFDLHNTLKSKYIFAEKCTICVIVNTEEDKEKVQRDEYYYSKIFTDRINILPIKSNKAIKLIFSPMSDASDIGDYTINAFDYFDGLCATNYIEFLTNAKDGDIVKYPKIVNNSLFRYYAQKLYNIELIK